ncbi:MAG: UDP-N-acetylmuramoyl-L-alanine--D-glutamate ligase [Candidatus Babeliales bacterium]
MEFKNKNIGIWGLGVVGTSAVRYLHAQGAHLQVLDNRILSGEETAFLAQYSIAWFNADKLLPFLEHNEFILPSPGIDLRPYAHYQSKWLSELDIFAAAYKKPIIAITGSIGKTSVTHLLSTILSTQFQVATGGNIGTAMFDLLATPSDIAVLEVSSFQLDLCQSFAPDLAILTNFYPNHLDRHGTEDEYFRAKGKIFSQQKEHQKTLLPLNLYKKIYPLGQPARANTAIFSLSRPTDMELTAIDPALAIFYIENNYIVLHHNYGEQKLIALSDLPEASFIENWLIICSALHMLNVRLDSLGDIKNSLTVPEHRLEKVATINDIIFYNDSKSTTPQSTLAAITQLQGKPIHLFVGGISKGIKREDFIKQLHGQVKQVHCFGKEREQLYSWCMQAAIPATCSTTLEEAFATCAKQSAPGEQIVFSPAGASFDLFKDYKERGNKFKDLVKKLTTQI